jgi:hypothetical protein
MTRFVLTLTACGAFALVFAALTARYVFVELPARVAERATHGLAQSAGEIANQVAAAFQVRPKVVVSTKTLVEQQADVLKLVTLEQSLTERERLDESWLHSSKTLEVEADFVVRAGFDLAKPFVVEIEERTGALRVTLPPAEILSTEMRDVRFVHDEDGWWNRITDDDRERTLRDLRLRVGLRARESDLLAKARASAEKRLTNLLASSGRAVTFEPAPSRRD